MQIRVDPELQAYIDPLTPDEHEALERSILAEGCRDALVLWGDLLVDGHNRYGICSKHGLPFQTVQSTRFQSIEDVHLWMIDQHLGRRSLSDYQRGVLALRKREITAQRRARAEAQTYATADAAQAGVDAPPEATPAPAQEAADTLDTREALARAARLSASQVQQIEKISRSAAPEVVAAVKAGEISLTAAATVASLPVEEQVAAAAGGAAELKQAAKRVREGKRRAPAETSGASEAAPEAPDAVAGPETVDTLRQRVAALKAENAGLRAQVAALQARLGEPADENRPPWE